MPDISTLIKKSDYDTKIAEIENKNVRNTRFITKRHFDTKIIELENDIKKLQIFDSSYILKVKVILKKMVYKIIYK